MRPLQAGRGACIIIVSALLLLPPLLVCRRMVDASWWEMELIAEPNAWVDDSVVESIGKREVGDIFSIFFLFFSFSLFPLFIFELRKY
ncbi:hypothetical protein F5Y08DRAFT_293063 [Xylaria arbuscula]|nr:hypothetical protein F5Y08DRAFT_293063 [Xylaria arbuscula]